MLGISGSYGGLNVGDEAILTCIVAELRRRVPDARFVVFSRNPDHTRASHAVDRAVDVRRLGRAEVERELRAVDVLLLGGGGLLFNGEAQLYLREVQVALELGIPVMTYAIGVGPLDVEETRRHVAATLNRIDVITVREAPARRLLEELGVVRPIRLTADPALCLSPRPFTDEMLAKEGVRTERHLVGVSVREPGGAAPDLHGVDYQTLLANAADFIADRVDADLLFVPMERGDIRHSHSVIGRMAHAERAFVLKGTYGPETILGLMAHFDMVLGMRLHFLIFAALQRVPFVPLPYAAKVAGFLEDLGLPARILREEHTGPLLASIDRAWDFRHQLRETLEQRVPELQRRAQQTAEIAAGLAAIRPSGREEPHPLLS